MDDENGSLNETIALFSLPEYTLITTPVTVTSENGDIIQHAIIQHVSSEQENIDPQTQVSRCNHPKNSTTFACSKDSQ